MTRNGKIARLPRQVRDELNRRLRDGQKGSQLVVWLNALPKVKAALAKDFGGRPLSEQNVSQWKQGGYQDWLAGQDVLTQASELACDTRDLEDKTAQSLTDHLAKAIGIRLATLLARQGEEFDQAAFQQLRALGPIARMVVQLRRSDHQAARLEREDERWDLESAQLYQQEHESEMERHKEMALAPIWAQANLGSMAKTLGGGEGGERMAAFILETQHGLKPGTLRPRVFPFPLGPKPVQPYQAQPEKIKANQSGSK